MCSRRDPRTTRAANSAGPGTGRTAASPAVGRRQAVAQPRRAARGGRARREAPGGAHGCRTRASRGSPLADRVLIALLGLQGLAGHARTEARRPLRYLRLLLLRQLRLRFGRRLLAEGAQASHHGAPAAHAPARLALLL